MNALSVRHILAFISFVIPMLAVGFGYKFGIFADEYRALNVYRDDVLLPFAFGSLIIQGIFWAYIYSKLFRNERFFVGSLKLFSLSFPLGLSFNVFVIGAKHVMTSISQFALLETGFTIIAYIIICPLIALSYGIRSRNE